MSQQPIPPQTKTIQERWLEEMQHPFAVTMDVATGRYQFGAASFSQVATPNPSHKDYSRIETAKAKLAESKRDVKRAQMIRIHGVEQRAPWIPPSEDNRFDKMRPDIRKFGKILKLKFPRGM